MRSLIVLAVLLPACGDDRVLAPVTLHTGDAPLIAIDPMADGRWERLPPNVHVTTEVGPRWLAVTVCGWPRGPAEVYATAFSDLDGDDITLPCRADPDNLVEVPVTLVGADYAELAVGNYGGWADVDESSVRALPGAHSVIARNDDWFALKGVIQRDVFFEDGTELTLDFDQDGFALEDRDVTVRGEIGDTWAGSHLLLADGTDAAFLYASPADTATFAPSSELGDGDRQFVDVTSSDDVRWSRAWREIGAGPIELALSVPAIEAEFSRSPFAVVWSVEADWRSPRMTIAYPVDPGDPTRGSVVWRYGDALANEQGMLLFPDVSAIPGWHGAWDLPVDRPVSVGVYLERGDLASYDSIGWSRTFPAE